jgi:hypothetical protein
MIFEQPANLNRFVAEPVSSFWAKRWESLRIFVPLLAFIAFCSVELLAWQLWVRDQLNLKGLAPGLVPAAILLVLVLTWYVIRLFDDRLARRTLNLLEPGISFSAGGHRLIPWSRVVAFWGEDIPGEPQWSKVTIEYFGWRKTGPPLRWAMALGKQDKYPALLSELDRVRQTQRLGFRVELDKHLPAPPATASYLMLGMWLTVAGMVLLLHGAPLLLASLGHAHGDPGQPDWVNLWPGEIGPKATGFLKAHFANAAVLRSRMAEAGGALCVLGAAFCVAGNLAGRRQEEVSQDSANLPKGP